MRKVAEFVLIIVVLATAAIAAFLHIKEKDRIPEYRIPEPVKVAIVLDDFGYNLKNLDSVFGLEVPVTFSILPNLPYSEKIARGARLKNYETILHLPLQPHEENKPLEKSTILCDMEAPEVIARLEEAMASVPGFSGISNHMGSKATENESLMRTIFERAKKENLFFMDSLVTPDTVCKKIAGEVGIGFVHRSVFLDNEADPDYIKGQIRELANQASVTGWAVGVGHDRAGTIRVLKEMIPELEKNGVQFVFLSELTK